jgi:hypothetical protein
MVILKSKFFWLNLIAILVLVIQYFITNEMFPAWAAYLSLAVVVLNAVAGMLQGNQVAKLKIKLDRKNTAGENHK